jgi:hypothetical protein
VTYRCASGAVKFGLVAVTLMIPAAAAHEWYPRECCGEMDCAPVERVEPLPDGSQRLTSRVGNTVVPASFPRRESPDHQIHICMVRYTHFENMRPVCLFVPPPRTQTPSSSRNHKSLGRMIASDRR